MWCQSEEGILSRQRSCLEGTARHGQVVWRRGHCQTWAGCLETRALPDMGRLSGVRDVPDMGRLSGDEGTARHGQVVWRRFFMCFNRMARHPSASSTATPSLVWSERRDRHVIVEALVSVCMGHISSTNSGNLELIKHDN